MQRLDAPRAYSRERQLRCHRRLLHRLGPADHGRACAGDGSDGAAARANRTSNLSSVRDTSAIYPALRTGRSERAACVTSEESRAEFAIFHHRLQEHRWRTSRPRSRPASRAWRRPDSCGTCGRTRTRSTGCTGRPAVRRLTGGADLQGPGVRPTSGVFGTDFVVRRASPPFADGAFAEPGVESPPRCTIWLCGA